MFTSNIPPLRERVSSMAEDVQAHAKANLVTGGVGCDAQGHCRRAPEHMLGQAARLLRMTVRRAQS